jgi:hypothetical protein
MATMFRPKQDGRILFGPLLGALCLLAVPSATARAQTVTVALDRSPGDSPVLIDEPSKAPGNIPEIIRPTDGYGDMLGPKSVADPGSVLTPPSVDPRIFASERRP